MRAPCQRDRAQQVQEDHPLACQLFPNEGEDRPTGPIARRALQRLRGMTGAADNEATLEDVSILSGPRANA